MHKNKQFVFWALKEPHTYGHINKKVLCFCVVINLLFYCMKISAWKGLLSHFVSWPIMWGVLWALKSFTGYKWWNGVELILWFKSVSVGFSNLQIFIFFSVSFLLEFKRGKKKKKQSVSGAENNCRWIRLHWLDLTFPEIIPGPRSLKNIKEQ